MTSATSTNVPTPAPVICAHDAVGWQADGLPSRPHKQKVSLVHLRGQLDTVRKKRTRAHNLHAQQSLFASLPMT